MGLRVGDIVFSKEEPSSWLSDPMWSALDKKYVWVCLFLYMYIYTYVCVYVCNFTLTEHVGLYIYVCV